MTTNSPEVDNGDDDGSGNGVLELELADDFTSISDNEDEDFSRLQLVINIDSLNTVQSDVESGKHGDAGSRAVSPANSSMTRLKLPSLKSTSYSSSVRSNTLQFINYESTHL